MCACLGISFLPAVCVCVCVGGGGRGTHLWGSSSYFYPSREGGQLNFALM